MKKFLDDVPIYDDQSMPEHEGAIFPIVIVCGIVIVILGLMYIVGQFFLP